MWTMRVKISWLRVLTDGGASDVAYWGGGDAISRSLNPDSLLVVLID